jgi:hypothetical protein
MNSLRFSRDREIELFVLCIWLFLIRIAIPYEKYVFVPYFLCFFAYTIFKTTQIEDKRTFVKNYLRTFPAFLLICLFFLIGLLLSSRYDFYFLKEGLAMIVLISLGIMAFIFIVNEDDCKSFTRIFMNQFMVFCVIICFLSFIKLFFLLRGVKFGFLSDSTGMYPNGSSLVIDYNFYSLVSILGIVTAAFLLVKEKSGTRSVLLQLLIFGLIYNVLFSTSRRGIAILTLVVAILLIIFLFGWMAKKGTWIAILSGKLKFAFLILFSFSFFFVLFLSQRPFHSRSSLYIKMGFDRTTGKDLLYMCAVRYYTIIEPQFQNTAMDRYFEMFNKTGQIGDLNRIFEINRQKKGFTSLDSLRLGIQKELKTDAYLNGILYDPENRFSGGRLQRINYGLKIYSERYSLPKKIAGGGFDYLWDFGNEFYKKNLNRFYFDYPHNPVLSALLYSGILGGLSVVYFFLMTMINFIKGFRNLIYFVCLYVIIFSFAFFSGNSIFGNPEFVFVSLIPFYFKVVPFKGEQQGKIIA